MTGTGTTSSTVTIPEGYFLRVTDGAFRLYRTHPRKLILQTGNWNEVLEALEKLKENMPGS